MTPRSSALLHAQHRVSLTSHQYLMVDIVTNHMAYMGCGACVDYRLFAPFSSVWAARILSTCR